MKKIKDETQYQKVLKEIDLIWNLPDVEPNSEVGKRLEELTQMVMEYEDQFIK